MNYLFTRRKNVYKFSKNCHGFETKIRLNGHVTENNVQNAIEQFVRDTPNSNHGIKILAIVLMAHGGEGDL